MSIINQHFKKYVLLLLIFGLSRLYAQEAIPASGGEASNNGGSVSYSIGQLVYTTNTEANGSVSQGIEQPFEISIVLGIEQNLINLSFVVFPNPTTDLLTIQNKSDYKNNISYQIYDINGRLLLSKKLSGENTTISTSNLAVSSYFIKIIQSNKVIKIFKILKK